MIRMAVGLRRMSVRVHPPIDPDQRGRAAISELLIHATRSQRRAKVRDAGCSHLEPVDRLEDQMRARSTIWGAAALAATLLAAGCGDDSGSSADPQAFAAAARVAQFECPDQALDAGTARPGPAAAKLQVITTVAPITSIVANVAGDR